MNRLALGLLAVLVALTTAAAGEDERQPGPIGGLSFVDEYELTIVNVIAYVTDAKGDPVTTLTREDFKLLQDGDEQQISNFQLYTEEIYRRHTETLAGVPQEEPVPETIPEPQPVFMVIYVDNHNIHPLDRNRVLSQVNGFVLENLQPPVQMMVVSLEQEVKILQPFTSESRSVLDALRELRNHSGGRPLRDSARSDLLDRMAKEAARTGRVTGYTARSTQAYSDVLSYAEEESYNLLISLDGLREVVTLLSGIPGRKSILYVSNGLPMTPGLDMFNAFDYSFGDPTILTETQRYDRSSSFKSLVDAANSQDVSFYTIDAGGLAVAGLPRGTQRSVQDMGAAPLTNTYIGSLQYMANGTGGQAIVNTNDFAGGLERIQKDLHVYYSLGYRLIPSGGDKVHRIEVSLPDHPELVVRSRRRFVEKSIETRVRERTVAGVLHDLDDNPMGLALSFGAAALATEDHWIVPLHVSAPIGQIALLPEADDYVGKVVLFVAARDAKGDRSEPVRQEYELRIPASRYESSVNKSFGMDASLLMLAGTYHVTIGLMDQVTNQASYVSAATTVSSR